MPRLPLLLVLLAFAACDSGITGSGPESAPAFDISAKRAKVAVCHVGSETGPAGETWDPACVPGDDNGWFCPDAGKVDLIEVADAAKHLGNPTHAFGGLSDYEPTGAGSEDSDGDGIDDGCEFEPACPCWDGSELTAVTSENLSPDACSGYVGIGGSARAIFSDDDLFPVGFVADPFGEGTGPYCGVLYPVESSQQIPAAEAEICVAQIEARCAEIEGGGPVILDSRSTVRTRR